MPNNRILLYLPSCEDLQAFICDSPWGMAEIDAEGNFSWLNKAYCQILNSPIELLIGRSIEGFVHPDDREIFKLKMGQVASGEETSFILSKKYIQRGSSPRRQLVSWGILSVQGKWEATSGSYLGARLTFREYDPIAAAPKWDLSQVRPLLVYSIQWSYQNWKTVTTVLALAALLMGGSSAKLLETLQRVKDTKQSVDSLLAPLSPGVSQPASLPSSPSPP